LAAQRFRLFPSRTGDNSVEDASKHNTLGLYECVE